MPYLVFQIINRDASRCVDRRRRRLKSFGDSFSSFLNFEMEFREITNKKLKKNIPEN